MADGVHVGDGQTGQGADWSERYAETGGWPPPAADQRRYDPGANPPGPPPPSAAGTPADADPTAPWTPPPDQPTYGAAPDQPTYGAAPDQPGYGNASQAGYGGGPGQAGYTGAPDQAGYGSTPDQAAYGGGPDQAGYGAGPGPAGYGAPGAGSGPVPQWGQPANQDGATGPWAPGDSAYGRLTGGGPRRPPPQRPRRPWDDRPRPAARRRAGGGAPITVGLIVVCVVVFLLQQADPTITTRYGLVPLFVEQGQYERLITAAFLHANVLHLATNMLTLYIVGAPLERAVRTARYLTIYLLSALGGSLLSLWLSPEFSNGVGASGAIFGLFGALLILRRQVGAEAGGLVVLIGLNLFISFAVPNISWQAHIGGLITGVLVALVLQATNRVRRRPTG
jgi:membrane associated rhomboid family serine protease